MKIGFIGLGNMGGAVAQALAKLEKYELLLSNHNPQKAKALQEKIGGQVLSNSDIIAAADAIFLGIKPHLMASFLTQEAEKFQGKKDTIWISMAAGITLAQLEEWLPNQSIIRMMPNTPVAIGQGMTSFATNRPAIAPIFQEWMAASGQTIELPEHQIDAATAIAGCGPAFVYEFIESLTSAGVQNGLPVQLAQSLASQTVLGAAQLVQESQEHPAVLRDQVTSPGGATIAGLVALTEAGFQAATVQAVNQALLRTKELGK
ncbi:pyrroline-5-carboxylate reductase [Streptococcus cameli]